MIQFDTPHLGLGASSKIVGFYYSEKDTPIGYQGYQTDFTAYESGWTWHDDADNVEYVERIIPGWFWYEMHF